MELVVLVMLYQLQSHVASNEMIQRLCMLLCQGWSWKRLARFKAFSLSLPRRQEKTMKRIGTRLGVEMCTFRA
jgi:hypothetical protein